MISCFLTADGRYDAKSGLIRPTAFPSHFEIRQPQSARAIHLVWQVSAQDGATAIVMVSIWHRSGILRKWQPVTVSNQKVNAVSRFPTHTHHCRGPHASSLYFYISNVTVTQHANFARFKFSSSTRLDAHFPSSKSHKASCRRYPSKLQKEFPYAETTWNT